MPHLGCLIYAKQLDVFLGDNWDNGDNFFYHAVQRLPMCLAVRDADNVLSLLS